MLPSVKVITDVMHVFHSNLLFRLVPHYSRDLHGGLACCEQCAVNVFLSLRVQVPII